MTGAEIALVATALGTATSAVGAIKQGNAASKAAKFNAQVASNNAAAARAAGSENALRERRNTLRRQGTMRAKMGSGAAWDMLEDQVMEDELKILSILHEGDLQADNYETAAILERRRGRTVKQEGMFSSAGILLKGSSKGATQYDELPSTSFLKL
tara:strand:- start:208 stop:675 length:468 start_codon:yes stop_codon:yes gene_type:complete